MDRRSRLVVCLALVLVAAACGSGDTSESWSTTSVSSTTTQPATTDMTTSTTAPPTTIPPTTTRSPPTTATTTTAPPDATPPELVITAPQPGATVTTRTFRFEGTTEPGCTVTAAGRYAADVDTQGNWSIVLVLNPGSNLATFVANDQAGNATTANIAIHYQPPAHADSTVLIANEHGVYQVDPDGDVTTLLEGEVAAAVDDTRGGLLFQTHQGRNWEDEEDWSTVIWWVPKGGSSPQRLLVPDPGTDHELTLHDTYRTDTGFVVVYTRHEGYTPFEHPPTMNDRLRTYNVETRSIEELYRVRGYEWSLEQVSAGGELIAATEYQTSGRGCILLDTSGDAVTRPGVPTSPDCLVGEKFDCPHSCSLCGDGSRAAYIDPGQPGAADNDVILVRSTATGEGVARVTIPIDRAELPAYLDALSIEGSFLVANRHIDHAYGLDNFLEALLFDLDNPGAAGHELPISGRARLVETAVDIANTVTISDQ